MGYRDDYEGGQDDYDDECGGRIHFANKGSLCPASQWSWGRPPIDHAVTLAAFTKPTTTQGA